MSLTFPLSMIQSISTMASKTFVLQLNHEWCGFQNLPPTKKLRQLKAAGRAFERRFVTTGLTVHKLAYRGIFIGNSKQLFSAINHFLKPHSHITLQRTSAILFQPLHLFFSPSLAVPSSPQLDDPTILPVGCLSYSLHHSKGS